MHARWLVIAAVAACGGSPRHDVTTDPLRNAGRGVSPPIGFANCDLVTLLDQTLTTYAIGTGGTLTELGTGSFGNLALAGDWADREHLVVRVSERSVFVITARDMTEVAAPPAAAFDLPKPTVEHDAEYLEPGDQSLVVATGAAYWTVCPWGFPFDGFQCITPVAAQLWPNHTAPKPGDVTARSWQWVERVPARANVSLSNDGELKCTLSGSEAVFYVAKPEQVHSYHWVSAAPPRLLVIYGSPGLADIVPDRWSLHDGCSEASLAAGPDEVVPGPAGLWRANEQTGDNPDAPKRQIVRRGGAVVGEVPVDATVVFRPR